jgi:SnoaL-like domain
MDMEIDDAMTSTDTGLQEMLDEFHLRKLVHAYFAISGDNAEGEIYTIATHTMAGADGDVDVVVGGRYLDKYEKRDGAWRFVERTIVTDWACVNDPSTVDLSHPITRDTPRGSPDANDPSYRFFSLLNSQT